METGRLDREPGGLRSIGPKESDRTEATGHMHSRRNRGIKDKRNIEKKDEKKKQIYEGVVSIIPYKNFQKL